MNEGDIITESLIALPGEQRITICAYLLGIPDCCVTVNSNLDPIELAHIMGDMLRIL